MVSYVIIVKLSGGAERERALREGEKAEQELMKELENSENNH